MFRRIGCGRAAGKVGRLLAGSSLYDAPILNCPCCGADLFAERDGSGACGVTGLVLPAALCGRLRDAFPIRLEVEHTLDDAYFDARWYCPSCRSPLANDDSMCPRCHRSLRELAAELLAANPTRCSREPPKDR